MQTKRCRKCGEVKSLDEFHRNSVYKDGRKIRCKICSTAQQRAYTAKDPEYREKAKAKIRALREDPKYREKINTQQRIRYAEDPEYREKRRARTKANMRAYRINDPEKHRAQQRKAYHKKKGEELVVQLMIAANFIQGEFVKGIKDGNKSINKKRRKSV